jgi:hypothetical protein
MTLRGRMGWQCAVALVLGAGAVMNAQTPARLNHADMEQLVARTALYPNPMLVQILSASTYSEQVPDAAKWSDEHHYLTGDALAAAMKADHLPWDPTVQALLPFPSVLEMMAGDMAWTSKLGAAVLVQRGDVLDAVQRLRHKALQYGYLKTTPQEIVAGGVYVGIVPVRWDFFAVPIYDPAIVFAAPPRGAVVTPVTFGFGLTLGAAFAPWWRGMSIAWENRSWHMGDITWNRTWENHLTYVFHATTPRYDASKRVEIHQLIPRSEKEKEAAHLGKVEEEHGRR